MYDVIAIGELLIDFATQSADAEGYPTMKANPGGAPGNFLADHTADHAANESGNQKKGERICRDIAHNGICILLSITAD